MRHRFTAPTADRLDKLVAAHTPLSRKQARAAIKRGGARVDGGPVRFESQLVEAGAIVEIRTTGVAPPAPASSTSSASDDEARPEAGVVVDRYREGGILVVDKPAGLPTQPTRQGTRRHLYGILSAREGYAGLHHRLDTPASGLILLTLDPALNKTIADAFQNGLLRRTYLTVVVGDPGEAGRWSTPIDGQRAVTRWRRISHQEGMSALEVDLETGRTHQIRRHAAEAGFPVLGDRRHGGAAGRAWPRLALHASALRFYHPRLHQEVSVTSPPPPDLLPLLVQAGFPSSPPEDAGEE